MQDLGLKVCMGCRTPKITVGITGISENLGRQDGMEEHYWGPSELLQVFDITITGLHLTSQRPCWWSRTKAFRSPGN